MNQRRSTKGTKQVRFKKGRMVEQGGLRDGAELYTAIVAGSPCDHVMSKVAVASVADVGRVAVAGGVGFAVGVGEGELAQPAPLRYVLRRHLPAHQELTKLPSL